MPHLQRRFFPALLLAAPLFVNSDWVRSGERPQFQPREGTVVSRSVSLEGEIELEEMTMVMDGKDMSEMMNMEMTMKSSLELAVTDRYVGVADGRATQLKRTYDEIALNTHMSGSHPMAGEQEQDVPLSSDLEGTTVLFVWNAEEQAYDAKFDGEGDEALLEALEENLDLRGFLPENEVAEGDSWTVSAADVRAALAPGGDLKLRPEAGSAGPGMGSMEQFSQSDMIGELEGEFVAVFKGTRDEKGVRVAVIELKIDGTSAQDMTARLEELQEGMKSSLPEGLEMEIKAMDLEYELEAEGELLWDLERGLAHSLRLSGDVRFIVDNSMSVSMGEMHQEIESSQTFTGNQTLTLTTGE